MHIAGWQFAVFRDSLCLPIVEVAIVFEELAGRQRVRTFEMYPKGEEEDADEQQKRNYGFEA